MNKAKLCPVCGRKYYGYPAISRADNNTEICPECGAKEALDAFTKAILSEGIKNGKESL